MSATCKRCGAANLSWRETQHGWRLHDGTNFHECSKLDQLAAALSGLTPSQWDPATELLWRRKQVDDLATFLSKLSEDPDMPPKFKPLIATVNPTG